jgi:aliphatic aldoxime dehydratase
MAMESAIPVNLETTRTRHKRVPDDYRPPYPSFVARYKPAVSRVAMVYFGAQYRGSAPAAAATEALAEIAGLFGAEGGPSHWDRAHHVDQVGHANIVSVAYWDDIARFDAWFAPAREAWTGKRRDGVGTFIEALRPSVERHETLFSSLGPRASRSSPTA